MVSSWKRGYGKEGVEALIAAHPADTVHGRDFVHDWDAPARALRSSASAAAAFPDDIVGEELSLDGSRVVVRRFQPTAATRDTTGAIAAMSLWAGESVGGVTKVQPAAEIVADLAGEAVRHLRWWADGRGGTDFLRATTN